MNSEKDSLLENRNYFEQQNCYQFQELINAFEHFSKLTVCILFKTHYDEKPTYKARTFLDRIGHLNNFCTLVKSSPNFKGCGGYDGIQRAKKAEILRKPFIDECPCGVVELIIPLIVKNEFVGTIFCGQIRRYNNIEKSFSYVFDKVEQRGCSRDALYRAYKNFHYYTNNEILMMGNLFFNAISNISDSLDDVSIERAIKLQQNQIIKETVNMLQSAKDNEDDFPSAREISDDLGISQEYFSRLFKKVMNINFIDYITELRIARAQELLTNTNLSIIDITLEVGYEQQSYFSKKFKELTGVTPSKYRFSSSILQKNHR